MIESEIGNILVCEAMIAAEVPFPPTLWCVGLVMGCMYHHTPIRVMSYAGHLLIPTDTVSALTPFMLNTGPTVTQPSKVTCKYDKSSTPLFTFC